MWLWLSKLEGAQSNLLGSFAGFIFGILALIVGALFNFHLNRRRDNRLRNEEAQAVAAALYGEIILIRKELARTATIVANIDTTKREFDKHFLELIRLQEPHLYRALASKIGQIQPSLVLAITEFYSNAELVRAWLPHLVEDKDRGFSYSALSVLKPAIRAIDGIKPTIDSLSSQMGIEPPTDDFDIGLAYDVVEMEDAFRTKQGVKR